MDTSTGAETVPVGWLLARAELALIPHHVADLEARLAWAHAIEIEDPAPWLRGPGLVLTTGLRLPRGKQGQEAYVARLAAAGAVALGFGTGLRFAAIPFAVVAACREQSLTLIEVPLPTPFLAVVQALGDRLGELRRLQLQESVRHQRELTAAALRDGPAGICRRLSRLTGAGVRLVDAATTSLATAGAAAPTAEDVRRETAADPLRSVLAIEPAGMLEIQPILTGHDVLGWLALRRDRPLTPTERVVVSHAVSLATLTLAHGASADGGPPLLEMGLVEAALTGTGWDLSSALAATGLSGDQLCPALVAGLEARSWASWRRALSGQAVVSRLVDDRVELIAAPTALAAAVAALPPEARVAVGTPAPLSGLPGQRAGLGRLLADAEPGRPSHLAHSPVERVRAEPAVAAAAEPWLAALTSYDAAHGADLVASVRAFVTHHGSWDPAATALGVHRHTLRHRVERAAALAGFDLDDPTHRAVLTLALSR